MMYMLIIGRGAESLLHIIVMETTFVLVKVRSLCGYFTMYMFGKDRISAANNVHYNYNIYNPGVINAMCVYLHIIYYNYHL